MVTHAIFVPCQMTLTSLLRPALACLMAALSLMPAWAEKADRSKPMNVVADHLKYDDLRQVSEFSGNVVLTKGTLVIRAGKLLVRQDPQGFQFGTATAAPGQRANFRQKREKLDEWIEGEAEELVYDGKADKLHFSHNAVIRRYKGSTLTDESAGHRITYDNTSDQFHVEGGKPGLTGQSRVRTMLSPRTEPEAGGTTAQTLQPSTSLTGDRK